MRLSAIISFTCFLVLALVDRSRAIDRDRAEETLADICVHSEGKQPTVVFTTIEQVREIIQVFEEAGDDLATEVINCTKFGASFAALKQVIDEQVTSDVCSDLAYARILNFHTRFVSPYTALATREQLLGAETGDNKQLMGQIPISLRNFFILFAQQVSGQCELMLVKRLANLSSKISGEDFELIRLMKKNSAQLLGQGYREQASKLRSVVLSPSRYYSPTEKQKEQEGDKLYVQVQFNDPLKRVKDVCEFRLKPVYEELFIPVIRYQALGYREEEHDKRDKKPLTWDSSYTRWYPAIEYCELILDIEVLHDDSHENVIANMAHQNSLFEAGKEIRPGRRVRFLSQEEAEELKHQIGEKATKATPISRAIGEELFNSNAIESVEISHKANPFEAQLWFSEPSSQLAAVHRFEKIISRMVWRKTNKLYLFSKQSYKSIRDKIRQINRQWTAMDETSTVGKVSAWVERHPVEVALIKLAIVAIFVSLKYVVGR